MSDTDKIAIILGMMQIVQLIQFVALWVAVCRIRARIEEIANE